MKKAFWFLPVLFALPALAVIPRFWEVRTYDQFRQGELESLSVTSDGEIVLAPRVDLIFETDEPLILSAVVDSSGNIFLGTGHEGRVYRVNPDGDGAVLEDLPELDVFALALDGDDNLFAATSPYGKVYRIDDDGSAVPFFEPEVTYIWSMLFDDEGRLLVGTGNDGVIYRVEPDGVGEVFYDSDETHIITLALDVNGDLIAGGDPRGYLYRISDDGDPFVLYDSGMREVHAVAVDSDGTIFAAVLGGGGETLPATSSGGTAQPVQAATVSVTVGLAAAQQVTVAGGGASPQAEARPSSAAGAGGGSGSSILEIRSDGVVTTLWQSGEELVYAILPEADRLLFSTGTRGRIYAYEGPQRTTLLVDSSEEQTTRLLAHRDRVLATTSNWGKLFAIGDVTARSGVYDSIVWNTEATSSWGKITWTGTGAPEILTRTGNTGSPDQTWSDWQSVGGDGEVASPKARFVQWRAVLNSRSDASPSLSSVTIPYLQQNYRPRVESVDLLKAGVRLQKVQSFNNNGAGADGGTNTGTSGRVVTTTTATPPRRVIESGVQALEWRAVDSNADTLLYSIHYRSGTEETWKQLADRVEDTFYTIASDTLPDGMYVVRVTASDLGSNPPELAMVASLESRPFAIDNTSPAVTILQEGVQDGRVRIRVRVEDGTSTLKQAEVALDAGNWTPVFPVDGIVDSLSEVFEYASPQLEQGEHVIAFRIYDQNENVGMGKTVVRIP